MPCIKSDAPWAQSWMAAHYGPPLDTSGHRHALHHIPCHLAAVMDDCDTWAAARRTLAGCPNPMSEAAVGQVQGGVY